MGGKGAKAQNSQMVQFEMQQAAEARQKEELRKARLEEGMRNIEGVFQGKPKMSKSVAKLDLTGINPGQWNQSQLGASQKIGDTGWTYKPEFIQTPWGGGVFYSGYDPAGNKRAEGELSWDALAKRLQGQEYEREFDTGEREGDPFANIKANYKTSLTDLHGKNLNATYNDALEEALFAHARAGQMGSTTRADTMADIGGRNYEKQADGSFKAIDYGQYGEAKNKITSDIDKSLADLNTQIQSAEDSAEQQLYMTEDPGKALTEAHKLAGNIPAVPQYNSLGDLFKPLVIGATGFYSGYQDQGAVNKAFATPKSPLGKGSGETSQG